MNRPPLPEDVLAGLALMSTDTCAIRRYVEILREQDRRQNETPGLDPAATEKLRGRIEFASQLLGRIKPQPTDDEERAR